jgi:hypothetical protein
MYTCTLAQAHIRLEWQLWQQCLIRQLLQLSITFVPPPSLLRRVIHWHEQHTAPSEVIEGEFFA